MTDERGKHASQLRSQDDALFSKSIAGSSSLADRELAYDLRPISQRYNYIWYCSSAIYVVKSPQASLAGIAAVASDVRRTWF